MPSQNTLSGYLTWKHWQSPALEWTLKLSGSQSLVVGNEDIWGLGFTQYVHFMGGHHLGLSLYLDNQSTRSVGVDWSMSL